MQEVERLTQGFFYGKGDGEEGEKGSLLIPARKNVEAPSGEEEEKERERAHCSSMDKQTQCVAAAKLTPKFDFAPLLCKITSVLSSASYC